MGHTRLWELDTSYLEGRWIMQLISDGNTNENVTVTVLKDSHTDMVIYQYLSFEVQHRFHTFFSLKITHLWLILGIISFTNIGQPPQPCIIVSSLFQCTELSLPLIQYNS